MANLVINNFEAVRFGGVVANLTEIELSQTAWQWLIAIKLSEVVARLPT